MKILVSIEGMMCGMCESHIKDAIRRTIPDAKRVSASHARGEASFELEHELPKAVLEHELHTAIDPTGYTIQKIEISSSKEPEKRGLFGRKK